MRISNKRKLGKATGMDSSWASSDSKGWIKDITNRRFRRRDREFTKEVRKAYNSDGRLPLEPHPSEGGYYAF